MHKKFVKNPSEMNEVTYKRIRNKFNKTKKSCKEKVLLWQTRKSITIWNLFDQILTDGFLNNQ